MRSFISAYQKLLLLLVATGFACTARAQSVVHHPDPGTPLADRMVWALEQARGEDGFWVGYQITRLMEDQNTLFVGRGINRGSGQRGGGPALEEVLAGRVTPAHSSAARRGTESWVSSDDGPLVEKAVAVLLRYAAARPDAVAEVMVGNVELSFDLNGKPIYWLGAADDAESIDWLAGRYAAASSASTQERLVAAVGVHQAPAQVVPFMRSVLASDADDDIREATSLWLGLQNDAAAIDLLEQTARTDRSGDVRESAVFGLSQAKRQQAFEVLVALAQDADDRDVREAAVFWIGQRDEAAALDVLEDLALNDPDESIREKAVFALAQLDTEDAVTRLIQIARTHDSRETRKNAIFWLGQVASERAAETLGAVVQEDESTEVQKQAVFALAQLDDGGGIDALVEISQTHPRLAVRKDAIFWLGQSGDPRALEAIEALLTQE